MLGLSRADFGSPKYDVYHGFCGRAAKCHLSLSRLFQIGYLMLSCPTINVLSCLKYMSPLCCDKTRHVDLHSQRGMSCLAACCEKTYW